MEVKKAAMTVFGYKMGEMVSLMIHVGDRLELWSALAALDWTTTAMLARVTSLHPRQARHAVPRPPRRPSSTLLGSGDSDRRGHRRWW